MSHDADNGSTWAPNTSTTANQDNPFSASSSGAGGGWGSSNDQGGSTWAPSTIDNGKVNDTASGIKILKEEPDYGIHDASAMGADDGQQAPVWFMERVCIQLKRNEKSAVIKDVNNNSAVIELEDKSTMTLSSGECTMVSPKEHDTVLVTGGADVGVEGELVCIDGTDAILRDPNGDFKIVDLVHLAKIVSES